MFAVAVAVAVAVSAASLASVPVLLVTVEMADPAADHESSTLAGSIHRGSCAAVATAACVKAGDTYHCQAVVALRACKCCVVVVVVADEVLEDRSLLLLLFGMGGGEEGELSTSGESGGVGPRGGGTGGNRVNEGGCMPLSGFAVTTCCTCCCCVKRRFRDCGRCRCPVVAAA